MFQNERFFFLQTLVLSIIVFMLSGCASSSYEEFDYNMQEGENALSAKKYASAISYYDNAVAKCSQVESKDCAIAYFNRAVAKEHVKDFKGAGEDFVQSGINQPENAQAWFHAGRMKFLIADDVSALSFLNKAILINPIYRDPYILRAMIKNTMKDYTGAIADYKTALKLAPNHPDNNMIKSRIIFLEKLKKQKH